MQTYHERVGWPAWCHALMLVPVLAGSCGVVAAIWRTELRGWPIVPFAVLLGLGWVWWRMRYLHLEFGPGGATFGFGGPHRHVPLERVVSAAPETYSAARYMGWGYRIGWKRRDRAYSLIGSRRGVRLEFDDEAGRRWQVFLACSDPEGAIRALHG